MPRLLANISCPTLLSGPTVCIHFAERSVSITEIDGLSLAERLQRPGRPLEIAFPAAFIFSLRLLALLPARLQLALGKRMVRSPIMEKGTP